MFQKLKTAIKRLFTGERFPDSSPEGGKKIGDVYDIDYMPDPEEPGHMMLVFSKKEEDQQ